ncbi:MAG TPA: TonB family protein [Allosphingosinicella sp.]
MAYGSDSSDRVRAAVPVALVHVLLAFALLRGLASAPPIPEQDELRLIELPPEQPVPAEEPPPPPPAPGRAQPLRQADPRPEGAASPPNLEARPTPIVAPEPIVPVPLPPPPIRAAPVAGTGLAPSAGAAAIRGPGTGSGGIGTGTGSGRGGGGAGGGGGGGGGGEGAGGVTPPRQIAGRLSIDDMPEALREAGFRGTVWVIYRVEASGGVTGCRVTRSSGSRALDSTTCRLIEQRFRFRPSRDALGRPSWGYIEEYHEFESEIEPPEPPRGRRRGW